jgi:LPS-assembly lipoprotein
MRKLSCALVLLLAACGFHLQGRALVATIMKVTYVESDDPQTEFQRGLRRALTTTGAQLVEQRDRATAVLRISKDDTGQRVLSVSARNTPQEYEVYYTVIYSVAAGGRELLSPQTLSLTRNYSFDEQALLAKDEEAEILRQAMARDLVGIVMRRLSSL